MSIVAIDLFCGVGGLTCGLLEAGIDVICGFDIEPAAKNAYEKNNKRPNGLNPTYHLKSVTDITKKDIFDIVGTKAKRKKDSTKFLLAGCAPCQPFSLKNKNRSDKSDKRRTLITYFANLVKTTDPDFVFMENVAGLDRFEPNNLKYFTDVLKQKGYSWDQGIVNALNYGVAQNRKRFVLLASKHGKVEIPKGEYDGITKSYETVEKVIGKLAPIEAGQAHPKIPNHRCANLAPINKERLKYKNRLDWPEHLWLKCHQNFKGHTDVYGRMDWKKPAPTLTTKFFSISTGRYGHPEQNRAISIHEGALLQSFPKNYIFDDTRLEKAARQIGNAVPPKMAKAFGEYFTTL